MWDHYCSISYCIVCTKCFHMFPPFSAMFGTPSTLLPWYRCSSPCKLSWSEPQWTLLSVELRILGYFDMPHMPNLFKALPFLRHASFPSLVLRFPTGLSRVSFLQLPPFPTGFPRFPPAQWFLHNFPRFSSISPFFFKMFLHFPSFSLVFSHLFPSVCSGPRENRTPPSPNCLVAHAPLKKTKITP